MKESTVESSITSTDLMGIAGGGENMIHNDVQMLRLEIICKCIFSVFLSASLVKVTNFY